MANSILDQSAQEVLRTLDEQLKECTPLEECPGEKGHGLDYAVRVEEMRKVHINLLKISGCLLQGFTVQCS
jgi:hypothetical protein